MRRAILENKLRTAVSLNGIWVTANSIQTALSNYTHPLFVLNPDYSDYPSLMASSIGIYYRSKYLLLCTRHQLNGVNYENAGILDRDGAKFTSSAGVRRYDGNEYEIQDLVAFEFTEPCEENPYMKERFFNLQCLPPQVPSSQIIAFIVSGYPAEKQDYNLSDTSKNLRLRRSSITCLLAPDKDQSKNDPTIVALKSYDELDYNPDGMSGGAVFVIQLHNNKSYAYLDGMIVRGGYGFFHFLKIEDILKWIDFWLDNVCMVPNKKRS